LRLDQVGLNYLAFYYTTKNGQMGAAAFQFAECDFAALLCGKVTSSGGKQ
jgi:hypothetical protein